MFSLLLAAALAPALADEPLLTRPDRIERLRIGWYDVDGTPMRFSAIEGWLLKDPASRPHVLKRHRMRAAGSTLVAVGTTAVIVGAGVIADAYDEEGKATDFVTWVPAVGGVVLLATGVPLVVLGNREARHAVEVYGAPQEGGATVTLQGRF